MTSEEKSKMFSEVCEQVFKRVEDEVAPRFFELAKELAEAQLECEQLRRELEAVNDNSSAALH